MNFWTKIRLLEQCEYIDDDIITTRGEEQRGMMRLNFFLFFLSFEDDLANYLVRVKVIIIQQQKRANNDDEGGFIFHKVS